MMVIGQTPLGAVDEFSAISIDIPSGYLRWKIELYHRSGGLKNQWYIGQDDCPIINFSAEENLKGCGSGEINFAYLDIPIDPDDYVKIYYYDSIKYVGIVDESCDLKGGTVKLIPWWQRYKESIYNSAYVAQTIDDMIADIVPALQTQTGINYNAALIDTGSSDVFTVEYNYEKVDKIFDDFMDDLDQRYWGVNANNFLYVSQFEQSVSNILNYNDLPAYSEIQVTKNYDNIEATRYQVLKKQTGTGETARIGEVGYSSDYPPIPLELTYRRIDDTITVSEVLTDSEALDYAYNKLLAQSFSESIEVNNIELDLWEPEIGRLVTVQDREEYICNTIIDCETTTNWDSSFPGGVYNDVGDFVEGTASIAYLYLNPTDKIGWMPSELPIYNYSKKLLFMLKSENSGNYLKINIYLNSTTYKNYAYSSGSYSDNEYSNGGTGETEETAIILSYDIVISTAGVWSLYEIELPDEIIKLKRIEFEAKESLDDVGMTTVHIDRIQLYQLFKKQFTNNVVQINYEISKDSENVTATLNKGNTKANSKLFELDRKIKILESVLDNTV